MTRFKVLVTAPYFVPVLDAWRSTFAEHGISVDVLAVRERAEEAELLPVIADYHGVICGDDRFTARVLAAARELRVLSKWGTGIDSLDQEECRRLGVRITNTPDAFSVPVADSVLGYALAFARNTAFMDQDMKAGVWRKVPGRALSECVFGIVGVGNVGRRVAERALAFGASLLGTDPKELDEAWTKRVGLEQVSLEELLSRSDFVSLCCDLNPTSHHLIDEARLRLFKQGAVLINTARGPIVDEAALARALSSGWLLGAALDVFEHEPLPEESPLRGMRNVLLAPHNSNSSPRAWEAVHARTVRSLIDVLEGPDLRRR